MKSPILVPVLVSLMSLCFIGNAQADDSLVLYFSFDEGAGNEAIDFSEYGNNGTIVPGADWVDGRFSGAIQVTSGAGHVELTPSDSMHGDISVKSFTLTAHINPALSDTWGQIWRSRPDSGSGHNTLFANAGGFLSWRAIAGGSWTTLCEGAAGDILADEWQHVAIVSDEVNYRMYINGEQVQESAFVVTDGVIETFYVGGDGQSENYTGAIDEVTVWNRALSKDEIKALSTEAVSASTTVEPADNLPTTWGRIKGY